MSARSHHALRRLRWLLLRRFAQLVKPKGSIDPLNLDHLEFRGVGLVTPVTRSWAKDPIDDRSFARTKDRSCAADRSSSTSIPAVRRAVHPRAGPLANARGRCRARPPAARRAPRRIARAPGGAPLARPRTWAPGATRRRARADRSSARGSAAGLRRADTRRRSRSSQCVRRRLLVGPTREVEPGVAVAVVRPLPAAIRSR